MKDLLWKAAAVFLLFGVVDLFRQRRRFMKDLRMTKQEVKQEHKESEGNPQVKGKIRRLRRDLARRRMMAEVRTATAVIVNPTHYAVALRYGFDSGDAGGGRERQELPGASNPRRLPAKAACRWWKIRCWRRPSTNRWTSAARFRRICTAPSPRCSRTSTS